jgi:CspA family cold shock protein
MQGQCKSFNPMKGYGFVIGPDGSDIFLHKNAMVDGSTPKTGDTIQFDMEPSEKNPGTMQAKNATGGTGWDSKGKGKGKGFDMWSMMQMMMGGWGGGYGASKGGWGGGKGGPYGGKGKGKGW